MKLTLPQSILGKVIEIKEQRNDKTLADTIRYLLFNHPEV